MGRQAQGIVGDAQTAEQTGMWMGFSTGGRLSPDQAAGQLMPKGLAGFTSVGDLGQSYMGAMQSGQPFGSPGFQNRIAGAAGLGQLFPGTGMGQSTSTGLLAGHPGGLHSPH